MLKKTSGPDAVGRDAMYSADRQDFAYRRGAYDYLASVAMAPRMAIMGAYVRAFGIDHVLDVGCGTAELLAYLPAAVAYTGIDIAPSALELARQRYAGRPQTRFLLGDFRDLAGEVTGIDGVVWAGIGCTWTRQGRGGNFRDWCDILDLTERPLAEGGILIFELVSQHWPALQQLIEHRYTYETGCDVDCFQSSESPRRSIRVFKKKALSAPGAAMRG